MVIKKAGYLAGLAFLGALSGYGCAIEERPRKEKISFVLEDGVFDGDRYSVQILQNGISMIKNDTEILGLGDDPDKINKIELYDLDNSEFKPFCIYKLVNGKWIMTNSLNPIECFPDNGPHYSGLLEMAAAARRFE